LLRLKGLLWNKSGSRLSKGRGSRLLRNSRLSKKLSMRGVCRVDEGIETSAVSAIRDGSRIRKCLRSGSSLRLDSLRLNSLCLDTLRLGCRSRRELCSICIHLEIQMGWISWIYERVNFRRLLIGSGRGKLLNWSCLELLLTYRSLTNWRLTDRSLSNRSRGSSGSFLNWLFNRISCNAWIKWCTV